MSESSDHNTNPLPNADWLFCRSQHRLPTGPAALLVISALVAVLAYWSGLPGPLILDDLPQLQGLLAERSEDFQTLWQNHILSTSGPLGRPVSMATFIANAATHGPDTWWWKFDNLMLHLVSGLLVAWLTALLVTASPIEEKLKPWGLGATVGALWLLHPLQVSTVLYTVQRMTELSTLFVLAGLICYLKGRLLQIRGHRGGWPVLAAGFVLFFPLAVLSKESGLLFPVYCSLIEVLVCRFAGPPVAARRLIKVHAALLAGYLAAGLYVLVNFSSVVLDAYSVRDFGLLERVLTQSRVIVTYLVQILFPAQRRMGFFHDDIVVSSGLLSPVTTLISVLALVALIAAAIRLRHRMPLVSFGILFYFATHLLESSVFALELMFEHRNYLGTAGILIAATAAVGPTLRRPGAALAATILATVVCSLLTWQRATTWSSPASLYIYTYTAHPESRRLNLIFANIHADSGNFDKARETLTRAGGGLGPAIHGLFFDCLEHGRVDRQAIFDAAETADGIVNAHVTSSLDSLTAEAVSGRCDVPDDGMVALFDGVAARKARAAADRRSVLLTYAMYLDATGETSAAVEKLKAAVALKGDDALPLYIAASQLIDHGDTAAARRMLSEARQLEDRIRIQRKAIAQDIYSAVASAYLEDDRPDLALEVYSEAIESMPRRSLAYVNKAELLNRLGRIDAADEALHTLLSSDAFDIDRYAYRIERLESSLARGVGR